VTGVLELRGVTKDYNVRDRTVRAIDGLDLRLSRGEFVCVVGASGSGKSTLLSMIAGLTRVSGGEITLDGEPVTGPGPDRGLVPQAGTLYPWRTVERNIAFGLELLPLDDGERARRVDWYLAETGLSGLRRSLPRQLSGGQQQRVAIARALACEPEVLLLDEPLGALDVQTKEDMQVFIRQVWKDTGATVLMVTHDVEEAVFLGERVVVLASDPGRMIAEVAVELPTDRDLAIKRVPTFLSLRASIEDLIRSERRSATIPGDGLSGRCDTNGRTAMKYGGVNGGSAPAPGPRRPQ
jgi:NitT/TauT family transport system ATP-binding protein